MKHLGTISSNQFDEEKVKLLGNQQVEEPRTFENMAWLTPTRITGVLIATAFFILVSSTISKPAAGAVLSQAKDNEVGEKLKLIRQLSKEAGLPQVNQEDVCLDEGCLDAALDILRAMNASVDPCQDFFQYTCGRWLANNPVPGTSARWSRFNGLRDGVNNITQTILNEEQNDADARPINQVKQFYKDCTNLEAIEAKGLQPLRDIISEFGGWQLLNPSQWNSTFDWLKEVAEVRRRTLQSAVISTYVSADIKNTSRSVVYIDQPGFGLPRGILIAPENYTAIISAYQRFIMEVAQELGTVQSEAELRAAANSIIDLEVSLARISKSDEDRYDMERIYNPFLLSEYQSVTDGIDSGFTISWKKYLDQVFSSSGVTISDNEDIVVHELDYIRNVIPILKTTAPSTLSNYVVWRLVAGLIPDTTEAMRNITFTFQQALTGQTQPTPRDVTCANAANSVFGMAIGVKYVEAAFDKDAKAEVEELVENLRVAFKEMVEEAEWMENVTKVAAIEKADAIRSFMAYPDWLENKTVVEEFYQGLELADSHFSNQLSLALYRMDKGLKALRGPTDRDEWVMYPGVVNAAYSPELNSITFPAGILQPPFFGKTRPKSQNYGGIGVVIGHEISHDKFPQRFDQQGSQFDKNGNVENWWDDLTKAEYNKRAQCMVDQYSGFYLEAADMYINGELTLGENIGDNGGLRESYRAYQKYILENGQEGRLPGLEALSPNQLFFVGYANIWCESITPEGLVNQILTDPHSPAEYRVKGPVRNSMEFADAFKCPVDEDGMNPPESQKCTVW